MLTSAAFFTDHFRKAVLPGATDCGSTEKFSIESAGAATCTGAGEPANGPGLGCVAGSGLGAATGSGLGAAVVAGVEVWPELWRAVIQ